MAAILIWPWEWRGTGENNESLLIFFKLLGENCQRENHIIFLFYALTSLESLFISLSLFGFPNNVLTGALLEGHRERGGRGGSAPPTPPPGWLRKQRVNSIIIIIIPPPLALVRKTPAGCQSCHKTWTAWRDGYIWWLRQLHPAQATTATRNARRKGISPAPGTPGKCDSASGSCTGVVPSQLSQCYWVLKFILGLKWGAQFGHLCLSHRVIPSPWQRNPRGHLALTSGWQDMEQWECCKHNQWFHLFKDSPKSEEFR